MKPYLFVLAVMVSVRALAQGGYAPLRGYWDRAGQQSVPAFTESINLLAFGADPKGLRSCNAALEAAIADLGGRPGVIDIPAGTFLFDAAFELKRDSIILRGAGHDSTLLRFDLGGRLQNAFTIAGSSASDTSLLTAAFVRGDSVITVAKPEAFSPGDWITLSCDDAEYMSSPWALGTLGQTAQIGSKSGNRLVLNSRSRFDYNLRLRPRIRRLQPRQQIAIECMSIVRVDATPGQTSTIVLDRAVNCSFSGLELGMSNFAQLELNRSARISVKNSFFHDAFAYGGGGQGYGVLLQNGSNECLVSGNYFRHLRHSMLLQSGANGNVISYNYSTRPHWTEPALPDSSAGEIVLHGDFPFMNLLEGNIVQNIVIDDSHGANGPLNTFFRNRALGFGFFMNFTQPTDSQQFIGNEVTNAAIGLYFISGRGHYQYGNRYPGNLNPAGSIPDASLYLPAGTRPECSDGIIWPSIGESGRFNAGTMPVLQRIAAGETATCACSSLPPETSVPTQQSAPQWVLAPNPAREDVRILGCDEATLVTITDAAGRIIRRSELAAGGAVSLQGLAPGLYLLRIAGAASVQTRRLLVVD